MCYVRYVLELINNREDFIWEPRYAQDWKTRPNDSIKTRYEIKAQSVGDPTIYLNFTKIQCGEVKIISKNA